MFSTGSSRRGSSSRATSKCRSPRSSSWRSAFAWSSVP